jgi:chromate reductase
MAQTRIGLVIGSLRAESINRKLATALAALGPQEWSFEHIRIDDLPLFNQDRESHPADSVKRLKSEIAQSAAILFVTPEYNRGIPGVLKNALDAASRPYGDSAWAKKPAGIVSVSGGKPGAAMAQQHLRNVLAYLDMPTLNQPEAYVQWTDDLVTSAGEIGEDSRAFLDGWMEAFVALVEAHSG